MTVGNRKLPELLRRAMLTVALIVMLIGCANTDPHHEIIEGRDCIVRRDPVGKVVALSCDWPR